MQFLETKVPPPLVGLIVAGLMWLVARQTPGLDFDLPWPILAPVVGGAGLLLSLAGMITFRRAGTTPNPFTHFSRRETGTGLPKPCHPAPPAPAL